MTGNATPCSSRTSGSSACSDERVRPRAAGVVPADEGLRFIGFQSRPGLLGFVAKQLKRVANSIAEELQSAPSLHRVR